ncbi:hypothetical protein Tco_0561223 [Tanacetum coccineum]
MALGDDELARLIVVSGFSVANGVLTSLGCQGGVVGILPIYVFAKLSFSGAGIPSGGWIVLTREGVKDNQSFWFPTFEEKGFGGSVSSIGFSRGIKRRDWGRRRLRERTVDGVLGMESLTERKKESMVDVAVDYARRSGTENLHSFVESREEVYTSDFLSEGTNLKRWVWEALGLSGVSPRRDPRVVDMVHVVNQSSVRFVIWIWVERRSPTLVGYLGHACFGWCTAMGRFLWRMDWLKVFNGDVEIFRADIVSGVFKSCFRHLPICVSCEVEFSSEPEYLSGGWKC